MGISGSTSGLWGSKHGRCWILQKSHGVGLSHVVSLIIANQASSAERGRNGTKSRANQMISNEAKRDNNLIVFFESGLLYQSSARITWCRATSSTAS